MGGGGGRDSVCGERGRKTIMALEQKIMSTLYSGDFPSCKPK